MKADNENKKLRIALLGVGSSAHIQRLASGLANRGNFVVVISAEKYGPFPVSDKVKYLTYDSKASAPRKLGQIRQILNDTQTEILHSHFVNHGGVLGVATGFHPHLISAWGCDVLNVPRESLLKKVAVVLSLRAADGLLPVSNQLRDEINKLTGGHPFNEVSHWGVNTDHFSITDAGKKFRDKYKISSDALVALSPRLVEPLYNQLQIIEAWPEVKSKVPHSKLVILRSIVNDPDYLHKLESRAKELKIEDDIIWIQKVTFDEMPGMYLAADVVVSVARSDGTPMTVLEAMSCGRPMVASDLPSLKDWVTEGENGWLVDYKNISKISQALIKALTLTKEQQSVISKKNRQKIVDQADYRKCIGRIEEIYHEFLGREPSLNVKTWGKSWSKTLKNLVGLR